MFGVQGLKKIFYAVKSIRVMGKINHDLKVPKIKNVHPSGSLGRGWNKCFERKSDIFNFKSPNKGSQTSCQGILGHKTYCPVKGNRNMGHFINSDFPIAFFNSNKAVFVHSSDSAFFTMLYNNRVILVESKKADVTSCFSRNTHAIFVVSIQNSPSIPLYGINYYLLYFGKIIKRVNI